MNASQRSWQIEKKNISDQFDQENKNTYDNYRYSSTNKNLWLIINDEMQEGSQLSLLSEGDSDHEE